MHRKHAYRQITISWQKISKKNASADFEWSSFGLSVYHQSNICDLFHSSSNRNFRILRILREWNILFCSIHIHKFISGKMNTYFDQSFHTILVLKPVPVHNIIYHAFNARSFLSLFFWFTRSTHTKIYSKKWVTYVYQSADKSVRFLCLSNLPTFKSVSFVQMFSVKYWNSQQRVEAFSTAAVIRLTFVGNVHFVGQIVHNCRANVFRLICERTCDNNYLRACRRHMNSAHMTKIQPIKIVKQH